MSSNFAPTKRPLRTEQIYQLSIAALLTAVILLMTFVPETGYITMPGFKITLLGLPIVLGAITLGTWGGGSLGALWGITSLLRAWVAPTSPFDYLFRNPLLSVIPRFLAGLFAALVFSALYKRYNRAATTGLAGGLAAATAALTNTVLVLGFAYAAYHNNFPQELRVLDGSILHFFYVAAGVNAPIELATSVLLGVPISLAVRKTLRKPN